MKELVRYTDAADQARLARNAMTRTRQKMNSKCLGENFQTLSVQEVPI